MDEENGPRERIVAAARRLLAAGGRDAVSTRAVSAEAGVQAPTLYRLFGDKQGLLDAVADDAFRAYLAAKDTQEPSDDPVADLRAGFDGHIAMGLAEPALYALMYADPQPGPPTAAVRAAWAALEARVHRVAAAGRLGVGEPLAAALLHAVGSGTTFALIATPEDRRDPALAVAARDAVLAAITTDAPAAPTPGPAGAAVALRAVLDDTAALTTPERALMVEWLDRIIGPASSPEHGARRERPGVAPPGSCAPRSG